MSNASDVALDNFRGSLFTRFTKYQILLNVLASKAEVCNTKARFS